MMPGSAIKNILGVFLLLTAAGVSVSGQVKDEDPNRPPDNMEEYQRNYEERIAQTHIAGVYIPATLEEALSDLIKLSPPEALDTFRMATEEVVVRKLFFSLGRWIIYHWGFYEGSRLSHHLRSMGIYHPDDMARVIMVSLHRRLNARPLALEEQIAAIQERIRLEEEERRKQAKVLHEERRPASERQR